MSSRRMLVALAVVVAVGLYGWFDVRNRARVDRGAKYHRTDFTVYQAAAKALMDGADPYEAKNPRGYRYVYPPLLAVLLMPLANVSPPTAALLFFLVTVAALALALRSLERGVLWGALISSPFLHESFERGQVTPILLALQAGALGAMLARRWLLAGLLLAAGTALRLTPALPAVALGLGLLAARDGFLRYLGGFALGLFLCFVAIPVAALGPGRATEVTVRWVSRTREVFVGAPGEFNDLDQINEYRYKNQSPRRVVATWTGWASGAKFEKERPVLSERAERGVDLAAYAIAGACALLALGVGWSRLRTIDPRAFALVMLLPVFMTRYAWPTHFVMALPAVAYAAPRFRLMFAVGVAAFYAAHAPAFEHVGAAGPLLMGGAILAAALSGPRP